MMEYVVCLTQNICKVFGSDTGITGPNVQDDI